MILAAAAASVSFLSVPGGITQPALAGIMVDLRVTSINGDTGAITNPKFVFMNRGDTVTLNVVVRISGTNAVQLTGNFDNAAPATDTRNDDTFQRLTGAFSSVGTAKGNFDATNQGIGTLVPPFNGYGSTNGVAQDFDSDGDLDLGALGTDPTNMWTAIAAAAQTPTISKRNASPQTRFGASNGTFFSETIAPNSGVNDTKIIDATTAEVLVGELTWIATAGNDSTTLINFIVRANGDAAALWTEDGTTTQRTPANSPFGVGAPVNIFVVPPSPPFPEPFGPSLLALLPARFLTRHRTARANDGRQM
jgi:hypothetical protein